MPTYEGIPKLESFVIEFEEKVIEPHGLLDLDLALKATPSRWWVAHKKNILELPKCRRLLEVIFGEKMLYTVSKYTGLTNLVEHIEHFRETWDISLRQEWIHKLIHTLEMIPRNWYMQVELRRVTVKWEELVANFMHAFEFVDDNSSIDVSL